MMGPSTAAVAALLSLGLTIPVLANAHSAAPYPATTFADCQKKTADPLEGCPEGTIYVSANDTRADFNKIQDAIISIGNDSEPHYILIGAGFYYEREGTPLPTRKCSMLTVPRTQRDPISASLPAGPVQPAI